MFSPSCSFGRSPALTPHWRRISASDCPHANSFHAPRNFPKFDFDTRIAVGIEDYATPVAMAEALHALIPGSALTVFDKARHLPPPEATGQPDIHKSDNLTPGGGLCPSA